jgi:hypothetical protein
MKRSNIVQLSTTPPPLEDSALWKKRAEEVRESEWALYEKTLEVVDKALDCMLARPFDPVSIRDMAKLLEVAFTLGRRAVGLPLDGSQQPFTSNSNFSFVPPQVDHTQNGRDGSPSGPPDNSSSGSPPPQPPTEIARVESPRTNVAASLPSLPSLTSFPSKPTEVASPEARTEVSDSSPQEDAEAQVHHPKKHKPYWLNGHYYPNPEFPYAVACAMVANSQRSHHYSRH